MDTIDPNLIKPRNDLVLVRRFKPETVMVDDPAFGGKRSVAFESLPGGLVLPASSTDITRATVMAVGPKCSIPVGATVGVPGRNQDSPVLRGYDAQGEMWEMWMQGQLDYGVEYH